MAIENFAINGICNKKPTIFVVTQNFKAKMQECVQKQNWFLI